MSGEMVERTGGRAEPRLLALLGRRGRLRLGTSFTQFAIPLLVSSSPARPEPGALQRRPVPPLPPVRAADRRVDGPHRPATADDRPHRPAGAGVGSVPLLRDLASLAGWILAVGFITATLGIFFQAAFAAIPSLVSQADLVTANGRIQASCRGERPGSAAGGAAGRGGPGGAGDLEPPLRGLGGRLEPDPAASTAARAATSIRLRADIVEGLRYVLRHPVLRNISAMMALVNFVGATAFAQLVFFAKEPPGGQRRPDRAAVLRRRRRRGRVLARGGPAP